MNNQHRTQNTIHSNKLNVEGIFVSFFFLFGLSVFVEICCFVVVCLLVSLLWLLLLCVLLLLACVFCCCCWFVCVGVGVGGSTDYPCFSVVTSFNRML